MNSQPTSEWARPLPRERLGSPFQIHAALSRSRLRVAEVVHRFAELFVVPPKPAAPTLIVEGNHSPLFQPLRQRPEMISILKERFGVAEIRDDDPASAVLVHGLFDFDEGVRLEVRYCGPHPIPECSGDNRPSHRSLRV